jgi:hypothetical protein
VLSSSSDYGSTWISASSDSSWNCIACSYDGSNVFVVGYEGSGIAISADFGFSYTSIWNGTSLSSVTTSSSGEIVLAGIYNGSIYLSTDYGSGNWSVSYSLSGNWYVLACSADCTYVYAADGSPGYLHMNNNAGSPNSWTFSYQLTAVWSALTTTSNGQTVYAAIYGGSIYENNNYGHPSDWIVSYSLDTVWFQMSTTADGSFVYGASYGHGIYSQSSQPTLQPTSSQPTLQPTLQPTSSQPSSSQPSVESSHPSPQPTSRSMTSEPTFSTSSAVSSLRPTNTPSTDILPVNSSSLAPTFVLNNQLFAPTAFPTPSPTVHRLSHGEYIGMSVGIVVFIILSAVLLNKRAYVEFSQVFFTTGDVVSDILFIIQVHSAMQADKVGKDQYHIPDDASSYQLNRQVYIASLFFLCLSIGFNVAWIFICGIKVFNIQPIDSGIAISDNLIRRCQAMTLSLLDTLRIIWYEEDILHIVAKAMIWYIALVHHLVILLAFIPCTIVLSVVMIIVSVLVCILITVITNLGIFFSAASNSELVFHFYGQKGLYRIITMGGMFLEDVPQLLIQISYAIIAKLRYNQQVTGLQILSFAFSSWRLGYGFVLKACQKEEKDPAPVAVEMSYQLVVTTTGDLQTGTESPVDLVTTGDLQSVV